MRSNGLTAGQKNSRALSMGHPSAMRAEFRPVSNPLSGRETLLRSFVEQSLDGIMLLDGSGCIIEWNRSLEEITGLAREEVLGRPFWGVQFQMAIPEKRDWELYSQLRSGLNAALSKQKTGWVGKLMDQEIERPDGERRFIQVMPFMVRHEGGAVLGSITRDITSRKIAEASLRQSEERYRTIVENINDALIIHDFSGVIIDVNENACRMFGYSRDDFKSINLMEFVGAENRQSFPERMKRLQTEAAIVFEGAHRRKDGTSIATEVSTRIVSREGNGLIQAFVRDVTERKKNEENLQRMQKLESLGALAGGIAHDFNNIMGGLFGYMEIARDYARDRKIRKIDEYMEKALRGYERAKHLTRQLITFARGEVPEKSVGDPGRMLRDTVEFALSGSNIKAKFFIADNLKAAEFDPNQMAQVIDNITINAKQSMPQGGVIEVTAENAVCTQGDGVPLREGDYVRLTIQDHGCGISAEHFPKIFDPFFTTKKGGSGLGLTTSWSIVKKHGGHIEAHSQPGQGSCFSVYLPATDAPMAAAEDAASADRPGTGRILLMDDEVAIRDTARALLESLGYAVSTATDGREALDLYKLVAGSARSFDLAIFDLTVPGGMGGKEAAAELSALYPDARIIASSGYSNDPVMSNPKLFGFRSALRKPYRKEQIGKIVESVLCESIIKK
jgi:two-component system cell cycle sensor histidine kinase/response regulator CckA